MTSPPTIKIIPTVDGSVEESHLYDKLSIENISIDTHINHTDANKPKIKVLSNNIIESGDSDSLILIGSVTAAEIKIAYESNPDTNAYTDSEKNIVGGVNQTFETIINTIADLQIPTALSQLTDDATHRVVTDIEKETWNDKIGINDIINGGNF